MIEVRELRRAFGGVVALDGVTLRLAEGERRAVIGPDGAGQTTLINTLPGEPAQPRGTIRRAGRDLSHGERRQLELAVALAQRPRVLLLDEPTAGMSPLETGRITELIAGLDRALTILIVEHDMDVVFRLADRVTVLHEGHVIADGTAADVRGDMRVHDVYLGKAVTVA